MRTLAAFGLVVASSLALSASPSRIPQEDALASPKLRIDWSEFKKLYDSKQVAVVDVRDPISFEAGHIPGALSVPLSQVEPRAAELKKLGKPIVLYCA